MSSDYQVQSMGVEGLASKILLELISKQDYITESQILEKAKFAGKAALETFKIINGEQENK